MRPESSRHSASPPSESTRTEPDGQWPPFRRVLLLNEPGAAGAAGLELARRLLEHEHAWLTVLSVVPQAPSGPRCGGSALEYNQALRAAAAGELDQARTALGDHAAHASFEMLIEGVDPPLADWCANAGFDLILLPAHRRPLRSLKHPAAAQLSRQTTSEVRIVGRRGER